MSLKHSSGPLNDISKQKYKDEANKDLDPTRPRNLDQKQAEIITNHRLSIQPDIISELSIEEISEVDSEKGKILLSIQNKNQMGGDTDEEVSRPYVPELYSHMTNSHSRSSSYSSDVSEPIEMISQPSEDNLEKLKDLKEPIYNPRENKQDLFDDISEMDLGLEEDEELKIKEVEKPKEALNLTAKTKDQVPGPVESVVEDLKDNLRLEKQKRLELESKIKGLQDQLLKFEALAENQLKKGSSRNLNEQYLSSPTSPSLIFKELDDYKKQSNQRIAELEFELKEEKKITERLKAVKEENKELSSQIQKLEEEKGMLLKEVDDFKINSSSNDDFCKPQLRKASSKEIGDIGFVRQEVKKLKKASSNQLLTSNRHSRNPSGDLNQQVSVSMFAITEEEFEERIGQKNKQIDELKSMAEDLKKENEGFKSKLELNTKEFEFLKIILTKIDKEDDLSEFMDTNSEKEPKEILIILVKILEKLQVTRKKLEEAEENLVSQWEQHISEVQDLNSRIADYQSSNKALVDQKNSIEYSLSIAEGSLTQIKFRNEELESKFKERLYNPKFRESKIKDLESNEKERKTSKDQISKYEEKLKETQENRDKLEFQVNALKEINEKLLQEKNQDQVTAASNKIQGLEQEIKEQIKLIEEKEQKISSLEKNFETSQNLTRNLQKKLNEAKEELIVVIEQSKKNEIEMTKEYQDQIKSLNEWIAKNKNENNAQKSSEVLNLKKELQEWENREFMLKAEILSLKNQKAEILLQKDQVEDDLLALNNNFAILNSELENLEEQERTNKNATNELKLLEKEFNEFRVNTNMLKESNEKLSELKFINQTLKDDLEKERKALILTNKANFENLAKITDLTQKIEDFKDKIKVEELKNLELKFSNERLVQEIQNNGKPSIDLKELENTIIQIQRELKRIDLNPIHSRLELIENNDKFEIKTNEILSAHRNNENLLETKVNLLESSIRLVNERINVLLNQSSKISESIDGNLDISKSISPMIDSIDVLKSNLDSLLTENKNSNKEIKEKLSKIENLKPEQKVYQEMDLRNTKPRDSKESLEKNIKKKLYKKIKREKRETCALMDKLIETRKEVEIYLKLNQNLKDKILSH